MYIIEFYSFLINLNNLLPFYYSFSSENPSLTPGRPLVRALQINKTHTTTKNSHITKKPKDQQKKKTKTKRVFSLLNFFPYKTKTKYLVSKIELNRTNGNHRQSSAIHYYEDDYGCFVLFFSNIYFSPKKLATESR